MAEIEEVETVVEAEAEIESTPMETEATEIAPIETPRDNGFQEELNTLRALARSAVEREQRSQAELDAMRMSQQVRPTEAEPTEEDFAQSPFATLQRMMKMQVEPLQDYTRQQKRTQSFHSEFDTYVSRTPALAPYADQIRGQLAQSLIGSDTAINQSVIDVHTNALIGRMVMNSASIPAPIANPPAPTNQVVPPTPPRPRGAKPADPSRLTESQVRTKKHIDPNNTIWPTNKDYLDYLTSDEREIPL